jgi:hypothetical protein
MTSCANVGGAAVLQQGGLGDGSESAAAGVTLDSVLQGMGQDSGGWATDVAMEWRAAQQQNGSFGDTLDWAANMAMRNT